MYTYLLHLILALALLSCQQAGESMATPEASTAYEMAADQTTEAKAQPASQTDGTAAAATPTLLLREADCRLEVDSIEAVIGKLEALASRYTGYLANVTLENYPYQRRVQLSVRVPAAHFEATLDSLSSWAKTLDYQQITTTDVTEEYVDLQSRLATKRAVRDRYLAILRNQAKTVEEILLAEEKIRVLQEEIEAKEGRLRYLENRATLSTIHVEIHQSVDSHSTDQPGWFRELLQDSWRALQGGGTMLRYLYLAILNLWPVLLLSALLWWKRQWFFRRWRKK